MFATLRFVAIDATERGSREIELHAIEPAFRFVKRAAEPVEFFVRDDVRAKPIFDLGEPLVVGFTERGKRALEVLLQRLGLGRDIRFSGHGCSLSRSIETVFRQAHARRLAQAMVVW